MAVKWMSGFEAGVTALAASGSGVTQSVDSAQHTTGGAFSLKEVCSSGAFALVLPGYTAAASTDDILFQVAIRSDQVPTSSAAVLASFDFGGGANYTNVVINLDGSISVVTASGQTTTTGTVRSGPSAGGLLSGANAWHVVGMRIRPSASATGIIQVAVDGSLALNTSSVISYGGAVGTTRVIQLNRWHVANGNFWMDDMVIMDSTTGLGSSGLPEPLRIESALVPTGDSSVQFTPSTGVSNWATIDEIPVSSGDYVSDTVIGHRDVYDLSNRAGGVTTTIYALQAEAWALNPDGGAASLKIGLKSSGTEAQTSALGLTTSSGRNTLIRETDPNGSISWTTTSVNAAQLTLETA